jgi:hypothetical protein
LMKIAQSLMLNISPSSSPYLAISKQVRSLPL